MAKIPDWRELGQLEQQDYIDWVHLEITKRLDEGERKYNSSETGFKGDPLQHAREELLDGLFYVYYAMRERDALLDEIDHLKNVIAGLEADL